MLIVIVFLAFTVIIISVGVNVGIIKKDRLIQNSWQNIASQTKRRHELIPFLVRIIKQYNNEDDELLDALQKLNEMAGSLSTIGERALLETELTFTINDIFNEYENFPEINNDNNYIKLSKTFFDIERQIEISKDYYNENILEFNTVLNSFPANIIAKKFNIHQRESFDYQGEYDYLDEDTELDEEDTVDENANDAVYNNGSSEEFR